LTRMRPMNDGLTHTHKHTGFPKVLKIGGHEIFRGEAGERSIEGLSEVLFQVLKDNKLRF
jgi:hypothetical protein